MKAKGIVSTCERSPIPRSLTGSLASHNLFIYQARKSVIYEAFVVMGVIGGVYLN